MKHDINLLQKRKATQYSGKKLGIILLAVVLVAALVYAGIALPSGQLDNAKAALARLDEQLVDQQATQQELVLKQAYNTALAQQVTELQKVSEIRSSAADYLDCIEKSLPTDAVVTYLELKDRLLTLNGSVPNDEVLATFALRLKETALFESVQVLSSSEIDDLTMFNIKLILPEALVSSIPVEDGSAYAQTTDDASTIANSGEVSE